MIPFAIPLEDRRNSGMAIYVKGVSSDEYHKEHMCANTQQCLLTGDLPMPQS